MKKLFACGFLFLFTLPAFAQVEHKSEWAAVRELQVTVPPPPELEARLREFEQRDSDAAVRNLAGELFGLMNPDYAPEEARQAELYQTAWEQFRAGKFRDALETYKLFSFARLRNPMAGAKITPSNPAKRTFIEFYNQADELMRGVFRFQVFDKPIPANVVEKGTDAIVNYYRAGKHNAHMVDLVEQNGMPGRMNWTYKVPGYFSGTWHIRDEEAFAAVAYRRDMCFTPLLVAYMEKKDPAYLKQWAGYMEDHLLNYRRDIAAVGLKMPVDPAGAGGPSFRHLAYLVLNAPDIDRDFPSTTFARLQLRIWIEDLPLIMLGSRATGANRAMHMYGSLLTEAFMQFPEFKFSDKLLEERRRILESYAREYMMPDGTSVDYAPNYNKNYIICPPSDVQFLSKMKQPPGWFTKSWVNELDRQREIMARYLIHSIAPDGTLPGYKDPIRDLCESTVGQNSYMKKYLPQALSDPLNKPIIDDLLAKAAVADPGYVSEAFPYGGYYIMRENWRPDARYLYFHDYRPGENGNWRHHKNIYVQAFGQRMLTSFRWESPLLVDGAGNMFDAFRDLYPKSYEGMRGIFGTHSSHSAWQEPLPNRWHTSARFDLAEGNLKIPLAQKFDNKQSVFIDDVAHGRQVIYLRDAGGWVVTDRIRAEKPHDYKLLWGFEAAELNPPGWETDWRNRGKKAPPARENAYRKDQIVTNAAAQEIRTENPKRPNLSIYHAASLPIRLTPGDILQNEDTMFGNSYCAGPDFHTDRTAVVASLLYPRKIAAPDMASFIPVSIKDGAGFDAKTPEGVAIGYRAALVPQVLEAGKVKTKASVLVVSQQPAKALSGIALDCSSFSVNGKRAIPPSADFEFMVDASGSVSFENIHRPLPPVRILPEQDVFVGGMDVTFEHPEPNVEIHYTLDGSEPSLQSPLFTKPVRLMASATVRAIAVRKGTAKIPPTTDSTLASIASTAIFRSEPSLWSTRQESSLKPGLTFRYFEDDWTLSLFKLAILKPLSEGVASQWMDLAARRENDNSYAFVYDGFIKVPQNGIYTFHGPFELFDIGERAGYDLHLEVGGKKWYPATQTHNYGNWSIPLEAGLHAIKLSYVDIRRGTRQATFPSSFKGDKPELLLSGPNLPPQPVPASWLFHK